MVYSQIIFSIQPSFHSEAQKFGGGKLSRPGGTDRISYHSSSSGAPASPYSPTVVSDGESSGEGHRQKQKKELQCLPSIRSPYSRAETQRFHELWGQARIQSTKKENGAVSTKAHCFCLCLPELSTVYQNGNRWHKANAHTFSQFPTKRTDVFITCYMTAFNKMWQEAEVERNGISLS